MKAAYLIKEGPADKAFEIRETATPKAGKGQVLLRVEGFGLNFADVMARNGLYKDAPPLPAILGYDVVGRIEAVGEDVHSVALGQRVVALTRFGGYAEYAVADERAIAIIPDEMSPGVAVALSTQYCTAYFLAEEMVKLHKEDHVLIHAAAGGVGTALVQLARNRGCTIYGTASSQKKLDMLKEAGVHYPINYKKEDFADAVRSISGDRGLDVIFDPVGGKSVLKGYKLLGAGGRLLSFGGSAMTNAKGFIGKMRVAFGFGIYSPISFLMNSKGIIGVNILRIADNRPHKIKHLLKSVVQMTTDGILQPVVGGEYTIDHLAEAHAFLESRKSVGKIVVLW